MKARTFIIDPGAPAGGNYESEVARLATRYGKPGEVRRVSVQHGLECALMAGLGPCNCSPTVSISGPLGSES